MTGPHVGIWKDEVMRALGEMVSTWRPDPSYEHAVVAVQVVVFLAAAVAVIEVVVYLTAAAEKKRKIYLDLPTKNKQCSRHYTFCILIYSKTCVKLPLKNRQNKDLNDKW